MVILGALTLLIQLLTWASAAFAIIRRFDTENHKLHLRIQELNSNQEKRLDKLEKHSQDIERMQREYRDAVPSLSTPGGARNYVEMTEHRHTRIQSRLDNHGRAIDQHGNLIRERMSDLVGTLSSIDKVGITDGRRERED
jgi:hypothetical protein